MRLVTLRNGGRSSPGVIVGSDILDLAACGEIVPAARLVPPSVRGILEAGDAGLDLVRRVVDLVGGDKVERERLRQAGALRDHEQAVLQAPVPNPGLVLSCGMNYREHLREMKTPVPEKPTAFTKNLASIVGSGAPIVLPAAHPNMVDWEGEFSAVVGRTCHNVRAPEALDYVAGYTLINDVSARDWVPEVFAATGLMGPILAWERNLLGKQFPTFCPMGPVLVTRDELPDPNDVRLTTTLNGEVMQAAHTSDLVFDVAHLVAYYSQFYRLCPGDVITTGSPAGVGYGRTPKLFMKPGDVIEVHAERIGTLSNPVVASG